MNIHLPRDVERSVEAAVRDGRFHSASDALTQAWRAFEHEYQTPPQSPGLGSIGAMRDDADELDEVVADAMKRRGEDAWRDISVE
jgi:Arc/MetJ-type ribon-helix-helix transcriptional regulator